MGTIVMNGDDLNAPVYLPETGAAPSWSGKSVYSLTKAEIEAVNTFATDEAWQIGYDMQRDGLPPAENPFHKGFLHGVPYALFAMFYRRGAMAAKVGAMGVPVEHLFAA